MITKRKMTAALFCLFIVTGYGQINDSLQIEGLLKQAKELKVTDNDLAISLASRAEVMAVENGFLDLEAVSYYTKGSIYDYHENYDSAEFWLLKWLEIRETQGANKERWALSGLQDYYIERKDIKKLDAINWKYIRLLQEKYCEDTGECDFKFRVGARILISEMVNLGGYEQAEAYFLESSKVSKRNPDWFSADLVYFQIEEALTEDSVELNDLYKRWFETIDKQPDSENTIIKTVNILVGKKRWNRHYMKPSIVLLEAAYPFLAQEEKKELLLKQFKDFKSGYIKNVRRLLSLFNYSSSRVYGAKYYREEEKI
jgi:tetratricopeptide (TPR) repeat protein